MELPGEDRGGDPSPRPGMRERERERRGKGKYFGVKFTQLQLMLIKNKIF